MDRRKISPFDFSSRQFLWLRWICSWTKRFSSRIPSHWYVQELCWRETKTELWGQRFYSRLSRRHEPDMARSNGRLRMGNIRCRSFDLWAWRDVRLLATGVWQANCPTVEMGPYRRVSRFFSLGLRVSHRSQCAGLYNSGKCR